MSGCSLEMKEGKLEETCDGKMISYGVNFSPLLYPESYATSSVGFLFADENLISPYNKNLNINKTKLEAVKKENKEKRIWIGDEEAVEDNDLSKPIHMGVNMIHNIVFEEAKTLENPFIDVGYVTKIKQPIQNSPNKIRGVVVQKDSAVGLSYYDPTKLENKDDSACKTSVIENVGSIYKYGAVPAEKGSPLFLIGYSLMNKDYKPCNYIIMAISDIDNFSTDEKIINKLKTDKLVGPLLYIDSAGKFPKAVQSQLDTSVEIPIANIKEYEKKAKEDGKEKENSDKYNSFHKIVHQLMYADDGSTAVLDTVKDSRNDSVIVLTKKGDNIIETPGIPMHGHVPMKSYVSQIVPTYSKNDPNDKNLYVRPEDILMNGQIQIYNTDLNIYEKSTSTIKMLTTFGAISEADMMKAIANPSQVLESLTICGEDKCILLDGGVIKNPSWYKFDKAKIINELFGGKEGFVANSQKCILCALCVIIAIFVVFVFLYVIIKCSNNNKQNLKNNFNMFENYEYL